MSWLLSPKLGYQAKLCQATKLGFLFFPRCLDGTLNNKMVIRGKLYGELFIFNILGVCFTLVDSNFNVEEIYGVKYGFQISKEPVLLKEVSFQRIFYPPMV